MKIIDITEFDQASSGAVVRLAALPGEEHAFYADYDLLAIAVHAIANRAPLHLSGQSGTGKSHFLNALLLGPKDNFSRICAGLDVPAWEGVKCHRLWVSSFETPAEIFYRTEVVNFSTIERRQRILEILAGAAADPRGLHVVWLVESGRGSSPSVQGGFLELVGADIVREPHGETWITSNVTFVTDSNYAANEAGDFVLWDLDQAYARRWTRRMTFAGLTPEQELVVLRELSPDSTEQQIQQVVLLALRIRERQEAGSLQSILPPTIDAELDLLNCLQTLKVGPKALVFNTLLGHCSRRDKDEAETVFAEAFGVRVSASTPAAQAVGVL